MTALALLLAFLLGLEAAKHLPKRYKRNSKMIYPPDKLNKR